MWTRSSLDPHTPLGEWVAQAGGRVGLVFTDVVDSTLLLYSRETVDFTHMLRSHRARAASLTDEHQGRLIDQRADEHLVAFPSVTEAWCFARTLFEDPGHETLRIRVGVHYGAVRAEGDTLVGRSIHLGARVMHHAEDRELWLSQPAKEGLEAESPELAAQIAWSSGEAVTLKGIPTPQRLWRAG